MGIVMQLLIERANFRITPRRENSWRGRKLARDIQSQHEPFVNQVGTTEPIRFANGLCRYAYRCGQSGSTQR
jgi:hypothetical protein